jgi:hypothetical protein
MKKKVSILLLVMVLAAGFSTMAFASQGYLTNPTTGFRAKYGTGITIDNCSLCHPKSNTASLNQYANDFASANHVFTTALENLDSDGDGFTNIAEITARTYPGDATSKPGTPPPSAGMGTWVGLWVKITTKTTGSCHGSSGMVSDSGSQVGYLKFWNWDSTNQILQADLYEYDAATAQWSSQSLDLVFVGGSDLDFLAQYQVTDNATNSTEGFTARIVGKGKGGVLTGATFKSLGGYYIDILNQSGAITHCAGGLKLTGALIAESKVPVPSNILLH